MSNTGNFSKKIKIIFYFFRPTKIKGLIFIVLTVLYGLIEMIAIAALYPVLDAGVETFSSGQQNTFNLRYIYSKIGSVFETNYLTTASLVLILVSIISFLYRTYYIYFNQKLMAFLSVHYKKKIYLKLTHSPYQFYVNEKQGRLVYITSVASESIGGTVDSLIRSFSETVKATFLIILLFISSWKTTLGIVFFAGIYVFISKFIIQKMVYHSSKKRLELSQLQLQNLSEFIKGIKSIKVYDQMFDWMNEYVSMAKKSADLLITIHIGTMLPGLFLQGVIGIGIGCAGVYLGAQPKETIILILPILGIFVMSSTRINGSVTTAITYVAAAANYFADLNIIYNFLENTSTDKTSYENETFSFRENISFKGVSFSYDKVERKVLNNVSFSILKNKTTALVGASGGGKTTIINLLLRLIENTEGEIKVDNVNIRALNLSSFLSKIGYVSQDSFFFNGSIMENIAFGRDASEEEIHNACSRADAHEFIMGLIDGYSTVVGDDGLKLSGGQRQRIGIARALLANPDILILDEPTSALDQKSEARVLETLKSIKSTITVIIIAHRLSTIKYADKIIVLNEGEVVESGSHSDLMRSEGYYSELYKNSNT